MNWEAMTLGIWHSLFETYNHNEAVAGKTQIKKYRNGTEVEYMLLPVAHTTQTAHIEITVDTNGDFFNAEAIDKTVTVLPFTEASGSRAGKSFKPHMLHDKLMYVAGDYAQFTGDTSKNEAFQNYVEQLKNWVDSPYTNETIQAIYSYVKKGHLIQDLVENKVLFVGGNGLLLQKWSGEADQKPKIFREITGDQTAAFIRFKIHEVDQYVEMPWRNAQLFESYMNYYVSLNRETGLCFVTGKEKPLATSHPNKIRNAGDKAKLISSNDTSGFTFRGRFTDASEVMSISYEASQKAHNALKFLIDRQGFTIDSRVFLLWGDRELDLPDVNQIDDSLFDLIDDSMIEEEAEVFTKDTIASNFEKMIKGYQSEKVNEADLQMVHIVELDAATPGRMAILNYRSLEISEYLNKISTWYQRMFWDKTYYNAAEKKWKHTRGTFTLREIVEKVYGPRPSSEMVMEGISRLYTCVLNQLDVPKDMVMKLFQRSCMPQAYDEMTYRQLLQIASVVIADKYRQEGYNMALQETYTNRSYLFGRLLAIADVFEERQLKESGNKRQTNALRYMTAYSTKPAAVYKTIFTQLQPYFSKAAMQGTEGKWSRNDFVQKKMADVMNQFEEGDFNNQPLDEQFILGYYNQRSFEFTKKGEN